MGRLRLPPQTADADVVRRIPISITRAPEHLAWCRKVAEHHAVEGDDGDEVSPLPSASFQAWLDSCEYCLFCHWRIIAQSLGSNP